MISFSTPFAYLLVCLFVSLVNLTVYMSVCFCLMSHLLLPLLPSQLVIERLQFAHDLPQHSSCLFVCLFVCFTCVSVNISVCFYFMSHLFLPFLPIQLVIECLQLAHNLLQHSSLLIQMCLLFSQTGLCILETGLLGSYNLFMQKTKQQHKINLSKDIGHVQDKVPFCPIHSTPIFGHNLFHSLDKINLQTACILLPHSNHTDAKIVRWKTIYCT